ncbi:MAG: LpxI family protein [Rhizobiaceae bacterium]
MATSEPTSLPLATGRVGILAGSGRLPALVAEALLAKGQRPFVINLGQETPQWMHGLDHVQVSVTRLSLLIKTLHSAKVSMLTMAGGISVRPKITEFLLDWRMYGEFYRLIRALRRGDDGLLRAAVDFLERNGLVVVGAHQLAPALLAGEATLTKRHPTAEDKQDIALAISAAIEHGRRDLGQAVVARANTIIAREQRDGTAAMLLRLKSDGSQPGNGVLVKWSKPNQELRVDLPSIGPDTILQAKQAGLAGIVVEAGRSLILDQSEVVRLADANNVFLAGMRSNP